MSVSRIGARKSIESQNEAYGDPRVGACRLFPGMAKIQPTPICTERLDRDIEVRWSN